MLRPEIDPGHEEKRSTLAVVGCLLLMVGAIFTLVGIGSFFSAFTSHEPPTLFWCAFIGLPLLGFGGMLLKFAFIGKIARYTAGEITPVATDTFNYAAGSAKSGIREVVQAVKEGLDADPAAAVAQQCRACGHQNDADARFCSKCGSPIGQRACPHCHHVNATDAQFCDQCGTGL